MADYYNRLALTLREIVLARSTAPITVMTLAAATSVAAQPLTPDPNRWRPVVYSDLQLPNEAALPYASLWADELRRNNDAYKVRGDKRWLVANAPASESHVVVRSPSRVVALSVLHTLTACRTVRSDPPHATLKRCPMRLVVFESGRSKVADAGQGCFVEYGARPDGGAPDLVRNAALVAYDADAKTIRAGVVFTGVAADECQFRIPIPQSRQETEP